MKKYDTRRSSSYLDAALKKDADAQQELVQRSLLELRFRGGGLTPDDRHGIINDTIVKHLEKRLSSSAYGRTLDNVRRQRRRDMKRRRDRRASLDNLPVGKNPSVPGNSDDLMIAMELGARTLEILFGALAQLLPEMTPKRRDLVIFFYGLEAFFATGADPRSGNGETGRTCQRARAELSERMQEHLRERLANAHSVDIEALRLSLEIVRGERYIEVLSVLEEFAAELCWSPDAA